MILFLYSITAFGADILITSRGPYLTLGRSLNWGSSGPGAIENIWLFTPLNPDQGICIFVTNRDTASHSLTLNVFQTGDPALNNYTGSTGRYRADTVQGSISPVAASTTTTAYVQTSAAAKVAIEITGTAGTGTADLYVVQTNTGSCGPVAGGVTTVQGAQAEAIAFSTNPVVVAAKDSASIIRTMQARASTGTLYHLLVDSATTCVTNQAIPTVDTLLLSATTTVFVLNVVNTTAASLTFTLKDNQATPQPYFSALSVSANNTVLWSPKPSMILSGGVRWQASASGLVGQICYF